MARFGSTKSTDRPLRVLYSFPHKIGAGRICNTAWQQVAGLVARGVDVTVFPGAVRREIPGALSVFPTLARGKFRVPYKVLGTMRACRLHDWIVSGRIEKMAGRFDVVHTWPLGALRTIKAARRCGIPTVLERPNAHTSFAFRVVETECNRLGLSMPAFHDHAYSAKILEREMAEYEAADRLLCPSDFVLRTFVAQGVGTEKLARHQYGFDPSIYYPRSTGEQRGLRQFTALFVGECSPRKGLHYALQAWLDSTASRDGVFLIAGEFLRGYDQTLARYLEHPSIRILGHRTDVPQLMRSADVLILPTVEEGSALVTYEARGSGCVLVVSNAAGAICRHLEDGLVHDAGDVAALAKHLNMLHQGPELLSRLREASLRTVEELTWAAATTRLIQVYKSVLEETNETPARTESPADTAEGRLEPPASNQDQETVLIRQDAMNARHV